MARLDYRKTRKLKRGEYEEKYDPGTVMPNGRTVSTTRPDNLATRAAKAEQKWLEERAQKRQQRRAKRRARNRRPTRAEEARLKAIRQQLGLAE